MASAVPEKRSTAKPSPAKETLGLLCILSLLAVKITPGFLLKGFAYILLPLYLIIKIKRNKKLLQIWRQAGLNISISEYYQKRLSTALHYIKSDFYQKLPVAPKVKGWHHLESARAHSDKLVLCGLHSGPFELQHKIPFEKYDINIGETKVLAANPAFSVFLEKYISQKRSQEKMKIVAPGDMGNALRRFFKTGGLLALMADQCPKPRKNFLKLLDSFSIPVPLKTLNFCDQNGACLIPISSYWEGNTPCVEIHPAFEGLNRENMEIAHTPKEPQPSKIEVELECFLKDFLESQIKKHPLEWNWSYPQISPL